MQFILGVILLLGQQGVVDTYRLEIAPVLLDSLYANPFANHQFPAFIETEVGACSCLAGFRGNSFLLRPKKKLAV